MPVLRRRFPGSKNPVCTRTSCTPSYLKGQSAPKSSSESITVAGGKGGNGGDGGGDGGGGDGGEGGGTASINKVNSPESLVVDVWIYRRSIGIYVS